MSALKGIQQRFVRHKPFYTRFHLEWFSTIVFTMKYLTLVAVALAAEQAAAVAVPFTNMDAAAKRADLAQIEFERAAGVDEV